MSLLERVAGPDDIRALGREQLPELASDVRERLIDVVSRLGGHFAPGLGVVELTVALHYVFQTPRDKVVWDVGHQAYPHKVLTGRNEGFAQIRQKGGPSPFLSRRESEYDVFGAGHAATSISAALGIATARDLNGDDFDVVAVIGDGSLTSGIAYEGLNNAGNAETDLIVVLNDNEMSISPNVGAIHKYLTRIVTNPAYNSLRERVKHLIHNRPSAFGQAMEGMLLKLEESVKNMLVPGTLFEELGFRYVGPVDGHDLDALVDTFTQVRKWEGPRLVHVRTTKGKGFHLAEANPVVWHGATPFDKLSGEMTSKKGLPAYTAVFGKGLKELGATNPKLAVITAAMPSGSGAGMFGDAYPARYFDVGIAEGHAITFAAGLATEGIRPVAAIYSTFLQRAYDSVIHDVAIQNLPVVFAMDRAGLVGNDGPTHAGLYDIAYLMAIPNVTVTAPKDGAEMLALLRMGVEEAQGPFALRYPRDNVPEAVPALEDIPRLPSASWEVLRRGHDVALLAVGTMVGPAMAAADRLAADGIEASVVNCRFLKPMDLPTLAWAVEAHDALVTIEEGTVVNGFGAAVVREIEPARGARPDLRVAVMGVPDRFVEHASRAEQLEEVGLTSAGIAEQARSLLASPAAVPVRGTA